MLPGIVDSQQMLDKQSSEHLTLRTALVESSVPEILLEAQTRQVDDLPKPGGSEGKDGTWPCLQPLCSLTFSPASPCPGYRQVLEVRED